MATSLILFYVLLFLVAFLYASVGHGGASGYLALGAIFSISQEVMKPTALLLNLFVSLTAFIQFYRGGYFKGKIFWPLATASIPASFLGGRMAIGSSFYNRMLGAFLLIPVIRFFFFPNIQVHEIKKSNPFLSLLIGGAIGLLSGMLGIGGGVILSPVLLLLKWTDQKQAAAISALFIFVNSLAGLAGQLTKGIHFTNDMYWYVIVAFAGGLAGAYLGALRFSHNVIKYLLATVLTIAAYKLLFTGI